MIRKLIIIIRLNQTNKESQHCCRERTVHKYIIYTCNMRSKLNAHSDAFGNARVSLMESERLIQWKTAYDSHLRLIMWAHYSNRFRILISVIGGREIFHRIAHIRPNNRPRTATPRREFDFDRCRCVHRLSGLCLSVGSCCSLEPTNH